ncbi:unnamed protein product [Ectocarpus sp. CCAP 1310/34]|nr:unnamed protein product [Ectocarpus sp. CCAP 1310/34]
MEGSGTRFEMELELMNCLASPEYLHYLAQSGYLDDRAFVRFLEYLQYFKRPEYAKFITYPHSLAMLDLLINNPPFRKEIAHVSFRDFVHQQQFLHWQFGKTAAPPRPPAASAPASAPASVGQGAQPPK